MKPPVTLLDHLVNCLSLLQLSNLFVALVEWEREVFDESVAFVCIALATNLVRARAGDGRKNRSSEIIALCLWRGSIYQSSAVILSDTRFFTPQNIIDESDEEE